MQKIYNIGFLRLIFTLVIIFFHLLSQPNTLYSLYPHLYLNMHNAALKGYLVVEIFFIIAGFFLYFTSKKEITFKGFVVNKFFRLWFVPAFAIFSIWLLSLIGYTGYSKYANVLHLCMLKNTGLTLCLADNGTAWFISVLFWVSLFYFYLLKNFDKKITNIVIALITFFSLVLLVNKTGGNIGDHYRMVNDFFNVGMLRGLSEMGLGYFVALFYEDVLLNSSNKQFSIKSFLNIKFLLFSILEISLFVFLIKSLLFVPIAFDNDLIFILVFVLIFILFIYKGGAFIKYY